MVPASNHFVTVIEEHRSGSEAGGTAQGPSLAVKRGEAKLAWEDTQRGSCLLCVAMQLGELPLAILEDDQGHWT